MLKDHRPHLLSLSGNGTISGFRRRFPEESVYKESSVKNLKLVHHTLLFIRNWGSQLCICILSIESLLLPAVIKWIAPVASRRREVWILDPDITLELGSNYLSPWRVAPVVLLRPYLVPVHWKSKLTFSVVSKWSAVLMEQTRSNKLVRKISNGSNHMKYTLELLPMKI